MSSSNSSQDHEPKQDKESAKVAESIDSQAPAVEGEVEEEEVGECPFCLYMKAGGCREEFINWEKCVEESEKNVEDAVEKCGEVTFLLKKCMEANRDYYEILLRAEEEELKVREGKERAEVTDQLGKGENGDDGSATLNGTETNSQEKKA